MYQWQKKHNFIIVTSSFMLNIILPMLYNVFKPVSDYEQ
jgi:hypothetical protein